MSALGDELLTALGSPRGRALLVDALREALATRDTHRRIDSAAVARKLGLKTAAALRQLFYRCREPDRQPHPLEELAHVGSRGRMTWLEADVDAWLEHGGGR